MTRSPRKNKFNARKVTIDGITFDSIAESKRYGELKILERVGEIADLFVHRRFPLIVKDTRVGAYVADFTYELVKEKRFVVEDVKSTATRTALYKFKRKVFEAQYPLRILEIVR